MLRSSSRNTDRFFPMLVALLAQVMGSSLKELLALMELKI